MAWVPNRAAQARCVPFAAFMLLLVLRGLVPGDGSWGFDPRWILAITVLVVAPCWPGTGANTASW